MPPYTRRVLWAPRVPLPHLVQLRGPSHAEVTVSEPVIGGKLLWGPGHLPPLHGRLSLGYVLRSQHGGV